MRASRTVKPVWPREVSGAPVRHPSRSRSAYIPRGQRGLELAATWHIDEAARLDRKAHELSLQRDAAKARKDRTTPAPSAAFVAPHNIRRAAIAAIPVLGFGLALAGLSASQRAAPTPPEQATAALEAPQAVGGPFATPPNVPAAGPAQPLPTAVAPNVMGRAPLLAARPVRLDNPSFTFAAIPPQVPAVPDNLTAPQPDAAFVCHDCTAPLAPFENVTVTVQADSADATALQTANAVLGAQTYVVTASQIDVTQTHVRFYRPEDAAAAQALAARYNAAVVDLTWFAPDAAPARIDLFVAPAKDGAGASATR